MGPGTPRREPHQDEWGSAPRSLWSYPCRCPPSRLGSVVVDNLDILGTGLGPSKANAPLLVHPDAVEPSPVASKLLKAIARWNSQVVKRLGSIKDQELAQRRALGHRIETPRTFASPDPLRVLVGERPQHSRSIT